MKSDLIAYNPFLRWSPFAGVTSKNALKPGNKNTLVTIVHRVHVVILLMVTML
jgi:hypothetical protein